VVVEILSRPPERVRVAAHAIETHSAALAATSFLRLHHSTAVLVVAAVAVKAVPPA